MAELKFYANRCIYEPGSEKEHACMKAITVDAVVQAIYETVPRR